MKRTLRLALLLALALWLVPGPLLAQGLSGKVPNGQIPGTATNDSACVGCVGEIAFTNVPNTTATVTITIASPGVITWTGHGLACAGAVNFTTSGTLPTGIVAGTTYYITCGASLQTNSFQISTSVANAIAGTSVNTSVSQSGTQTGISSATLANGVTNDIAGLSLTAGQWSCYGVVFFNPAGTTTVTAIVGGINTVSVTLPANAASGRVTINATLTTGNQQQMSIAPTAFKFASSTTLFLDGFSSFATSTMTAAGRLECVRQR